MVMARKKARIIPAISVLSLLFTVISPGFDWANSSVDNYLIFAN
jgi:hypothetical protein